MTKAKSRQIAEMWAQTAQTSSKFKQHVRPSCATAKHFPDTSCFGLSWPIWSYPFLSILILSRFCTMLCQAVSWIACVCMFLPSFAHIIPDLELGQSRAIAGRGWHETWEFKWILLESKQYNICKQKITKDMQRRLSMEMLDKFDNWLWGVRIKYHALWDAHFNSANLAAFASGPSEAWCPLMPRSPRWPKDAQGCPRMPKDAQGIKHDKTIQNYLMYPNDIDDIES